MPKLGKIISHYKIISAIGAGGMGEVYLAQDTKLDRKVAIKFLNQEFNKDADKLNRFIQEAKAASALNHPNILTVYEIGETDDTNYIVTELIEGKTLREHLHKESLQLNQILKIGVQVAEALSAAHTAGIVHRDIKPENIMIRKDGYAKVLDFGLAKLSDRDASVGGEDATRVQVNTMPGMVMGTVSYMSPEQARGNPTDARTDIWSLGVVLYEMLAGKVPFSGETVNHTIVSILEKEPLQLENVPVELQRIVRKSLTKDVDMRYQSARDMLIDLKNLRRDLDIQGELERSTVPNRDLTSTLPENATQMLSSGGESTVSGQNAATQNVTTSSSSLEYAVTQAKSHKLAAAAAAVLLVAVIAAVSYFGFLSKGSSKQINSIAVMPFVNESGNAEMEYLSDGMTETLISSLSNIPNLSVKARSTVFYYKGKETSAMKIGEELKVQAVLFGRVSQRGDDLKLSLELVNTETQDVIWSEQYNRKRSDLVSLQSEIAKNVSDKLRLKLTATEQERVTKTNTTSSDAQQLYLKGRFYWYKRTTEAYKKAIGFFNEAIEKDPNYALAYSGLAECYSLGNYPLPPKEKYPLAKQWALKAIELDDTLAEPHTALGRVKQEYEWDRDGAEKEFKRAIELNPSSSLAHMRYAGFFTLLGKPDEAIAESKKALVLDPLSVLINWDLAYSYYFARRYDEAIEQDHKTLEIDPNYIRSIYQTAMSYEQKGTVEKAFEWYLKGAALDGHTAEIVALKEAYATSGVRGYYRKQLDLEMAKAEPDLFNLAQLYARLGEKEKAFESLQKAMDEHSSGLIYMKVSSAFDNIRSDARFVDLMKHVGLVP